MRIFKNDSDPSLLFFRWRKRGWLRGKGVVSGEPSPAGWPGRMRARKLQSPALGILSGPQTGAVPYRARRRARESALPELPGSASAVPVGRRFTATRSWGGYRGKAWCSTLPAVPAVGQLLGRPGSSRLRKALQGEGMGVGEGEGLKDAVGIRNTPSPPNIHRACAGTQTLRKVLSTGPGQLLLLIHTASRLYRAWAAQDFSSCRGGKGWGMISPVTMGTVHRSHLLCGPVYPSLQRPQQPPGASSCYSPHFTVAQQG